MYPNISAITLMFLLLLKYFWSYPNISAITLIFLLLLKYFWCRIVGFFEVHKFREFCGCWSFVKFNPSKKPTTHCSVWAFGRPIRENKIGKKPKTSHSRNLSTSKKLTIQYYSNNYFWSYPNISAIILIFLLLLKYFWSYPNISAIILSLLLLLQYIFMELF